MISVNGVSIDFTSFPDNTTSFRYNPCCFEYNILWRYDDDRECILLWYLVNHIRENSEVAPEIVLTMPYIPNARMDRVKAKDEVFTLKWFSDFINLMYFDKIVVHDPHSNVSTALINHVVSVGAENETAQVLETLEDKNVIYGLVEIWQEIKKSGWTRSMKIMPRGLSPQNTYPKDTVRIFIATSKFTG